MRPCGHPLKHALLQRHTPMIHGRGKRKPVTNHAMFIRDVNAEIPESIRRPSQVRNTEENVQGGGGGGQKFLSEGLEDMNFYKKLRVSWMT